MIKPTTIKPIETQYAGCRFRSRLEARWAVFFDARHIAWEYEPDGFRLPGGGCYLPDFWLPQVSMYAEVKPGNSQDVMDIGEEALEKVIQLAVLRNRPVLILDGTPRQTNYWAVWPTAGWDGLDNDGLPWTWLDIDLCDPNDYHLSEARFYSSTGAPELIHEDLCDGELHPAIVAARSARFKR